MPKLGWMHSAAWSKPSLIIIALWVGLGQPMLIFLAGLKDIPKALLEAATIDGANGWQRYWRIVIPLLTPTIFFNLLITMIASFQIFTTAFVATATAPGATAAGPLNSMLVYMVHLYRQGFRYSAMGYASAMAVVLFVVLVGVTIVLVRFSNSWVHYEGAPPR